MSRIESAKDCQSDWNLDRLDRLESRQIFRSLLTATAGLTVITFEPQFEDECISCGLVSALGPKKNVGDALL